MFPGENEWVVLAQNAFRSICLDPPNRSGNALLIVVVLPLSGRGIGVGEAEGLLGHGARFAGWDRQFRGSFHLDLQGAFLKILWLHA